MDVPARVFVATQTLYSLVLVQSHNEDTNYSGKDIEWNKDLARKAFEMADWILEIEQEKRLAELAGMGNSRVATQHSLDAQK